MIDQENLFKSITLELNAVKDRVQHVIGHTHWQSVGEWKESALRAVLRRHLPKNAAIGRGFVIADEGPSTQIDILIYDTNAPVLFQDGDFVLIPPDGLKAAIEVKSSLNISELENDLTKLARIAEMVRSHGMNKPRPVFGFFAYEANGTNALRTAGELSKVANGHKERIIQLLSAGQSEFVRYWDCPPNEPQTGRALWRAYHLPETAPAYFICSIIKDLCLNDPFKFIGYSWVPLEGKEEFRTGDVPLYKPEQPETVSG